MKNWLTWSAVFTAAVILAGGGCADLNNELPTAVPGGVVVHPAGWNDTQSSTFHGIFLKGKQWQLNDCSGCHGLAFTGGTSNTACFTCHTSYPHPSGFASSGGHPVYLQTNRFPLAQCQSCHGAAYTGGSVVDVSCSKSGCHVDRNGVAKSPEACNTCHGNFSAPANDFASFAPPTSLSHDTATTVRGVGAHQRHLAAGILGKSLKCRECHSVPGQLSSPGHLGAPPAEVVFQDTLAGLVTGDGTNRPAVAYDPVTLKCNNTYCHGNWRVRRATSPFGALFYTDSVMSGARYAPVWTKGSTDAACGTCHGLPPAGHAPHPLSECALCHVGVVDNNGAIIDRTKHINGKVNVFGVERSF